MPRKTKIKGKKYRKKFRRLKKKPSLLQSVALGMPKSQYVRLKYCDTISLDPGDVGATTNYAFSANSIYDPNRSAIGHKPMYFAQLMAIYDKYTVLSSKIRVTPSNPTVSDIVPIMYGIILDDDANLTYTTADQIIESGQMNGGYKLVGPSNSPQTRYSNSVVRKFSAKNYFGVDDVAGQGDYSGSPTSNPNEEAFFNLWAASIGGTDGGNAYFTCEIEYLVQLSEIKYTAQST